MPKAVRITVIRNEYYQDLADRYAVPDLGPCPFHQEGQVFRSEEANRPDGMCRVGGGPHGPAAVGGRTGPTVRHLASG